MAVNAHAVMSAQSKGRSKRSRTQRRYTSQTASIAKATPNELMAKPAVRTRIGGAGVRVDSGKGSIRAISNGSRHAKAQSVAQSQASTARAITRSV